MNKKVSLILPYYNRKELFEYTLKTLEKIYRFNNLEIVVIDDGSRPDQNVDKLLENSYLETKLITINHPKQRTQVNPCYPYNVGVKQSTGDIIVLSSPETYHRTNMFEISNNFEKIDNSYLLFSVFCLTDKSLDRDNLDISLFHKNLGQNGHPFNNKYGSWYLHSRYRATGLNFFSAISRQNYYKLSGFDESYRNGTGFDDLEFKERVFKLVDDVIYYDNAIAIHQDHEIVHNLKPATNQRLYNQHFPYQHNNKWGIL
jgi:glycosyltransferase involved in cell wall biosynthesis